MNKIKLIILDVNETLFCLSGLDKVFHKIGLTTIHRELWFNSTLREGFALNKINKFVSFGEIGKNIFMGILKKNNISNACFIYDEILENFKKLKVQKNTYEGLYYLKKKNFKIATLTNGSKTITKHLLKNNNMEKLIDRCFSIDEIKSWKPSSKTYQLVTKHYNINPLNSLMIACHKWDLEGAKNAGLLTGYIERNVERSPGYYHTPDYSARNILEISKKIVGE